MISMTFRTGGLGHLLSMHMYHIMINNFYVEYFSIQIRNGMEVKKN